MKFSHTQTIGKPRWVRLVLVAIVVIFVIAGLASYGINSWYTQNLRPVSTATDEQVVVIVPGSSTQVIARQLAASELIRNESAFNWYVDRLEDERFLQAGTYSLTPNLSVQEIVEILLGGRVDTSLVTILPGLRLDEIRTDLIEVGFDESEVDKALVANYRHPLLNEKPAQATLEGYIFPETYQITAQTTVESLLNQAFSIFSERIDATITQGIARQGLTMHHAIILASIVQEEVSDPAEQKMVAQVFLHRLEEGLPLGADPTFRYAAYLTGEDESPTIDSPYNTRIVVGLPPGPIANFNLSALQAVAEPAETDYLYFVSGDDGVTHFSKTAEEHQANKEKYCIELCKL